MNVLDGSCLIDTNVLIYATTRTDPRHPAAADVLRQARAGGYAANVSGQNLAEVYPALTGPKRKPPDTPQQAGRRIGRLAGRPYLRVLPVDAAVVLRALELCENYGTTRQDYFDMQLVAATTLHGVETVVTENVKDFRHVREVRVVSPFE